ncbi:MAG: hypothetical protein IJB52_11865 [Clostridia bacterium]|nr:hypothetical protein [Clostridia bacterium]
MKKLPKFPLIMTVAAFVCFILAFAFLMLFTILPPYMEAMALLIPAVVLGGIALLVYLQVLPERAGDILTALLSVLFVFSSIFYTLFLGVFADLEGTKDIGYYEKLYHRLEDRPGMENFPEVVPESTGEILFFWNPQFLQGAERFQITFTPDARTYEQYQKTLPAVSRWYGVCDAWTGYGSGNADGTMYVFFWDEEYNHPEISYAVLHPDGSVTFSYTRG